MKDPKSPAPPPVLAGRAPPALINPKGGATMGAAAAAEAVRDYAFNRPEAVPRGSEAMAERAQIADVAHRMMEAGTGPEAVKVREELAALPTGPAATVVK